MNYNETVLRMICCACLSINRNMKKLSAIDFGANLFFRFYDAAKSDIAIFICLQKEAANLYACWECQAIIRRIIIFGERVKIAQKQLAEILLEDEIKSTHLIKPLSHLSKKYKSSYDKYYRTSKPEYEKLNISVACQTEKDYLEDLGSLEDCQPEKDNLDDLDPLTVCQPKEENLDDLDPLKVCQSKLQIDTENDFDIPVNIIATIERITYDTTTENKTINEETVTEYESDIESDVDYVIREKETTTDYKTSDEYETESTDTALEDNISDFEDLIDVINDNSKKIIKNKQFLTIRLTEKECLDRMEKRRVEKEFANWKYKCASCVLLFKKHIELLTHNVDCHTQKPNHTQCDICQVFVKKKSFLHHKKTHLILYQCKHCYNIFNNTFDIKKHMKNDHNSSTNMKLLADFDISEEENSDVDTETSYPCPNCKDVFKSKASRYEHMKTTHKSEVPCSICGKSYPSEQEVREHEEIHLEDKPYEEKPKEICLLCDKMVEIDSMGTHLRIHVEAKSYKCIPCEETFQSLNSYERHLKFAPAHTPGDPNIYKCTSCPRAYRNALALQDHVNYQHLGKTRHKCPICHKLLASSQCKRQHLKRVHKGLKRKFNHMCEQCGKVLMNEKSVLEHKLIHTGSRPLSCDTCGRAFRQSAALFTHKRLVHKVLPKNRVIEHIDEKT